MSGSSKTIDELQKEVLETQLETAKIALDKTRDENADYRRRKEVSARTNENRQRQFTADRAAHRRMQHDCQHMAGGDAEENPLEGGGKFAFSVLHVTVMPDGVTEFLQCPRCRLSLYGRKLSRKEETKLKTAAEAVEKRNPDGYMSDPVWLKHDDYQWWKELRDLYKREGLGKKAISRGPTFAFANAQGTPIVPDITGYSSSGAGGR